LELESEKSNLKIIMEENHLNFEKIRTQYPEMNPNIENLSMILK
jgi:hypothetical protein